MSSGGFKLSRALCVAVANVLVILSFLATQPLGGSAATALVESTYVYVPPTADRSEPLQVVVAVHGLGGNGKSFGSHLIEQANRNDWVIVAPTIHYGNWWNVDELVHEDTAFAQWLVGYLDTLHRESGVVARQRVLLFGFSRGAGVIGRFALLHPGRVLAGAALSSGAYTLPSAVDESGRALTFPFGVADLAAHGGRPFDAQEFATTRWFVGVGESDNEPKELPQVWTPFIGSTRVERAKKFSAALRQAGAEATLRIFPETGHFLTPEMRAESLAFMRETVPVRPPATSGPVKGTPTHVAGGHVTPTHVAAAATADVTHAPAASQTPAVVASPRPSPTGNHGPPVGVAGIPPSQAVTSEGVTPSPRPARPDEAAPTPHAAQPEEVMPSPTPHAAQPEEVMPSPTPHARQAEEVPPSQHAAGPDELSPAPHAAQPDEETPPPAVPAEPAPSAQPEAPSGGAPAPETPTDDPAVPPADEQVPDPSLLPPA